MNNLIHLLFKLEFFLLLVSIPHMALAVTSGNAGCLLRSGDQIVLVKDIWSKKFGLPGGTAERNETAAQTAERETLEETGLAVSARKRLATTSNGFHIFDCEPRSHQIEVVEGKTLQVPISAFNEIGEIKLLSPNQIPREQWRFPEQKELVSDLLTSASDSPIQKKSSSLVHSIIELELKWIQTFQKQQSSFLDRLFGFFSFLGGEGFALMLLPLIWFGVNKRQGLELTFFFALSVLIHGILKQIFGIPRPFYFLPELQRGEANGFGFPSGHTLSVTLVWSWIALNYRFIGRWVWVICIATLGGLARVYWGVHFFHDIVGGWFLGVVLVSAYALFLKQRRLAQVPMKVWYSLTGILGGISLVFRFHPDTVAVVCFLMGVIAVLRKTSEALDHPVKRHLRQRSVELGVALLGIVVISWAGKSFPHSGAFLSCLGARVFKYLLLGIWVSAISDWNWSQESTKLTCK